MKETISSKKCASDSIFVRYFKSLIKVTNFKCFIVEHFLVMSKCNQDEVGKHLFQIKIKTLEQPR